MADNSRFRMLSFREQAVVSVAVLLDGHDAPEYLLYDKERSNALSRAAKDLAALAPEVRMPLVGSLLRKALQELGQDFTNA